MNNTERLFSEYFHAKRENSRRKRPAREMKTTLLDVQTNGTVISVFKEKSILNCGPSIRIVVAVRRQRFGFGWSGLQKLFPVSQLETAILYANKLAQNEISRQSLVAIA